MTTGIGKTLAPGMERGPMQGVEIIGEVTEALQRHLMDTWEFERNPPRIEEDLSFVPKDREEVLYVYMYRAAANRTLMNTKRFRSSHLKPSGDDRIYYERAPLYLDLFYLVSVHAKFRSDAERLLGYGMLALHEATHLIYRPRKYTLPSGRMVNSKGDDWSLDVDMNDDDIIFEKVSLSLVDDLTIGDAINFFTIHEAPYRPYLTYCARCAMEGSLISGEATKVRTGSALSMNPRGSSNTRPSGRMMRPRDEDKAPFKAPFGPSGYNPSKLGSSPDSDDNDSNDQ